MSDSRSGMSGRAKRLRAVLWSLVLIAAGAMLLPLTAYVWTAAVQAEETASEGVNPRAKYWREVRDANPPTRFLTTHTRARSSTQTSTKWSFSAR